MVIMSWILLIINLILSIVMLFFLLLLFFDCFCGLFVFVIKQNCFNSSKNQANQMDGLVGM